jgi:ABC-type multidrug transport system permease subunit/predicted  nucleic acid-binding Zn-ribbon protein
LRLLSEIEKDAKQFMRERRTLILLIAAPLLVLFIMGAIFSGDSTLVGKSAIGICDLDRSNSSVFFIDGIKNSSDIINYGNLTNCSSAMETDVRNGKIAAGLVIPKGFEAGMENGDTQQISILLDNSRFQVTPSIEAFVKANVQEMDKRIGTQFILSVWQRLNNANSELATIFSDINETRDRATAMKADLKDTADSLNSLNISNIRDELRIANGTVARTSVSLDQAEQNLTKIEANFVNYTIALNQTESDLLDINNTLSNVSGHIDDARIGVNCSDIVFAAYCLSLDSLNASVGSAQQSVEQRIDRVREAQRGLADANVTVQEFKSNIASARVEVNDSQAKIGNMMAFVDELDRNRAEALLTISKVDASLDEMVTKTYELEGIITNSRNQISEITSSSPEFIISPLLVSPDNLFGKRPFFEFMLPSVLPLILMFISLFLASTSLVKEKYGGTLERVYTSQVNPFMYAAVKVVSYSIVLIPEAILLALIASVAYNAFPVFDTGAWLYVIQALALLTAAFVSMGVLIAIYSESEATAFLASLVVGLPMLFLSGLLFPFEFMPPLVSLFGTLSPLTQAIISMQATLLYHSPQLVSSLALLAYTAALTALAGLSLKK